MKTIIQLFLVLLLPLNYVFGTEVQWSQRLEGASTSNPLIAGRELLITDGDFSLLGTSGFTDAKQFAYVRLGMAEHTHSKYFNGMIDLTVNVTITPYSNTGVPGTAITDNLAVKYISTGSSNITIDADDYRMTGGVYMFRVVVNSITGTFTPTTGSPSAVTDLPNFVYLEGGIYAERYYAFDNTTTPSTAMNNISFSATGAETPTVGATVTAVNTDELEMTWGYIRGAEYYDVEWTWVDDYSTVLATPLATSAIGLTESDFAHNCTRVRTSKQSYRIPQLFAKGYLIYRIRAVGKWSTDTKKDKFGVWSSGVSTKTTVANWPNVYTIANEHQSTMNWQYHATFAEEGRRKDVTQYFDGSLRTRQTVTRMTSMNQSVVGETVYDNEGRAVVQILPVPQDNPAVKFYGNLNKNASGAPYSHQDFDWETTSSCVVNGAGPMNTSSGASQYYSPAAHSADVDWQQYVPDAQSYPFTEVEFTPDNTGRLRNQSGVGANHKIGSGHETYYYYLQPSQEELNRLFGYKVGYKARYKKNMIVDANGQVSVTYLDAQGRTIASALSGNDNTTFDALPSEQDNAHHLTINTDLLNKANATDVDTPLDDNLLFSTGHLGAGNDGLHVSTQIGVVDNASLYTFNYTADFSSYSESCGGPGVNFPYVYDLTLTLKDNCGAVKFSQTYSSLDASSFSGYIAHFTETHAVTLSRGTYTLYKEIKVNEAALAAYRAQYLDNAVNTCILPQSAFAGDEATNCEETECSACMDDLGTEAQYGLQFIGLGYSSAQLHAMYLEEQANCDALCAPASSCDAIYMMLIQDVMPGGQYGATDGSDAASVYMTTGGILEGNWKTPSGDYLDENGNIALVEIEAVTGGGYNPPASGPYGGPLANGHYTVQPEQLTNLSDFVNRFQDTWADALVPYHPEYDLYTFQLQFCADTTVGSQQLSSDDYDDFLTRFVMTYAQAQSNSTGIDFTSSADAIKLRDPFFQKTFPVISSVGLQNYNTIKNNLLTESFGTSPGFEGSGMSLLQYAVKIAVYGNDYTVGVPTQNTWALCAAAFTTAQMDAIWQAYKANYLSFKSEVKQLTQDVYGFTKPYAAPSGTYKIYNGAIGTSGMDFGYLHTFSYSSANYLNIVSGIITFWGSTLTDYPIAFAGTAYDSKVARFVRVNSLYNAGISASAAIAGLSAESDYGTWQATGLCPLTLDMERLLNALATRNLLKISTTNTTVPEMVPDLFTAIGGSGAPTTGSTMTMLGTVSGTNLVLNFTGTVPTSSYSVTLPELNSSIPWSTYGSSWFIYGISGSYPVSGTQIQVLVKAGATLATAKEYVITYTSTSIDLNACQADYAANNQNSGDCDKEEQFEASLLSMLQQLRAAGTLNGTGVSLTSLAGFTFSQIMQAHFGTSATWTGGTTSTITGANGATFAFNSIIPSTTPLVQYTSVDLIGNTLYLQYMNLSTGAITNQSNTWGYNDGKVSAPLRLNCAPCSDDQVNQYAKDFQDELNYLFALPVFVPPFVPPGQAFVARQSLITGGVTFDETAGYKIGSGGFNMAALQLDINTVPSGTYSAITLSLSSATFDDIAYIKDLAFSPDPMVDASFVYNASLGQWVYSTTSGNESTYHFTAVLTNGTEVSGGGRLAGYYSPNTIKPCDQCLPQPLAPLSCNTAYVTYKNAMDTKFAVGLTGDDLTAYTTDYLKSETDFCDNAYAYITGAYVSYINNAAVTNLFDSDYLSISEFGATPLGYSNTNLSNAVTYYFGTYLPSNPTPLRTWNDFVANVYLVLNPSLCPPIAPTITMQLTAEAPDPCMEANNLSLVNAQVQYDTYLEQMGDAFVQAYIQGAITSIKEQLTESHRSKEYHYTLFYYDRAGNLIQTVPPKGVKRFEYDATNAPMGTEPTHAQINAERAANATDGKVNDWTGTAGPTSQPAPDHALESIYRYNTLNQLVYKSTPDGGVIKFAYDGMGRMIASQNAKQLLTNSFNYTCYDALGRLAETGLFKTLVSGSPGTGYAISDKGRLVYNAAPTVEVPVGKVMWINSLPTGSPYNVTVTRSEVTRSVYDELAGMTTPMSTGTATILSLFGADYSALNTRNRMVATIYQTTYNASNNTFDNGTFYDYDVHGNVKHLIQINEDAGMKLMNQHVKHLYYEYDLVTGKTTKVIYQKDYIDQFIHRYQYDADNRVILAETSKDNVMFEKDAKYFYYEHGPLARTEIGDDKVQAQDFAYTIQGWLKAVNGEQLSSSLMMGKEGQSGTINGYIGKDAYGYSLSYFAGDYNSYNREMLGFSEDPASASYLGSGIYNGNIRSMSTVISDQNEALVSGYTHQTSYQYDQLNRIVAMTGYKAVTPGSAMALSGYKNQYTLDANGNITAMKSWSANSGGSMVVMDDFTYSYPTTTNNRLDHVDDAGVSPVFGAGIDMGDQSAGNYHYDAIGQLDIDAAEQVTQINWTVSNKVKDITYGGTLAGQKIEFTYDAFGHRIAKKVTQTNGSWITTFYTVDIEGKVMSTYTYYHSLDGDEYAYLSEQAIYGRNRIGVEQPPNTQLAGQTIVVPPVNGHYRNYIGDKEYELTNHLGNVLNVVTDRKIAFPGGTIPNQTIAGYTPNVVAYTDYYPYGMPLPYRNGNTTVYRYAFNGKEKTDEVYGNGNVYDYGYRVYNPRIARFLSVDPLTRKYPFLTPYQFASNTPTLGVDEDGLELIVGIGGAFTPEQLAHPFRDGAWKELTKYVVVQYGFEPQGLPGTARLLVTRTGETTKINLTGKLSGNLYLDMMGLPASETPAGPPASGEPVEEPAAIDHTSGTLAGSIEYKNRGKRLSFSGSATASPGELYPNDDVMERAKSVGEAGEALTILEDESVEPFNMAEAEERLRQSTEKALEVGFAIADMSVKPRVLGGTLPPMNAMETYKLMMALRARLAPPPIAPPALPPVANPASTGLVNPWARPAPGFKLPSVTTR